jgi:hypothetical protein
MNKKYIINLFLCWIFFSSCHSQNNALILNKKEYDNNGLGIGPHVISKLAETMTKSMLKVDLIIGKRVVLNSKQIKNESSNIINKNLISDKLRIELQKACNGKIKFLTTENISEIPLAPHYQLIGRIASMDMIDGKTGRRRRYTQITLEMYDSREMLAIGQ